MIEIVTTSNRLGFFRHAQVANPALGEKAPLDRGSRNILKKAASELATKIPYKKVVVFYAPAGKMQFSAEAIRTGLRCRTEFLGCKELDWLASLEILVLDNPKGIIEAKLNEILADYPDTFIIFVTHYHCVSVAANVPSTQVLHCSFFSNVFSSAGHQPF